MKVKDYIPSLITLFCLIIVWELTCRMWNIPEYLLPRPTDILQAFQTKNVPWSKHIFTTLFEIINGFLFGALIGIVSAIIIISSKTIEKILYPLLLLLQLVPKVAIAPILVVWFGFGYTPKIVIAFIIAFFPVVVNTMIGLRMIDPDLIDLAISLRASSWQIFSKLRFPNALPYIFGGLEISMTMAVVGAIVAEFVTSQAGLGYLILFASTNMEIPLMFAGVVVLSTLGVVLYIITALLSRILMPWHVSDTEKMMATA